MDRLTPFSLRTAQNDSAYIVSPQGEVDIATSPTFRSALEDAPGDAETLVIDLRDVVFMDTSGLQVIVEWRRRCEERGTGFAVVRGPHAVQRLLDIAGLSDHLPLVDAPQDAVGARERPPA